MTAPPIPVEALTRLNLKPGEVLAVTLGQDHATAQQMDEFGEFLEAWFDRHGVAVAGVVVLPKGSQLAAVAGNAGSIREAVRGEFDWGVVFTDADTGERVLTITECTIRVNPREIVTADVEMLADPDGKPLAQDAKPVLDDSGENVLTGVFRWVVAEMRVAE